MFYILRFHVAQSFTVRRMVIYLLAITFEYNALYGACERLIEQHLHVTWLLILTLKFSALHSITDHLISSVTYIIWLSYIKK